MSMNFVNIIEAQVTVNYFLKDRIEDKLKQEFKNKILAKQALSEKITEWQTKGYIEVSVDSIIENDKELKAYILLGKKYVWTNLKITDSIQKILDEYNINYPQNSKQSINQIIDIPKQILRQQRAGPINKKVNKKRKEARIKRKQYLLNKKIKHHNLN